jgi:hypothetical protein
MGILPGENAVVSGGKVVKYKPTTVGGAVSDAELVSMYFGGSEKIHTPKTKFSTAAESIIQYMMGLKI